MESRPEGEVVMLNMEWKRDSACTVISISFVSGIGAVGGIYWVLYSGIVFSHYFSIHHVHSQDQISIDNLFIDFIKTYS